MSLRLVQMLDDAGKRIVAAATAGTLGRQVNGATSVYALANEAIATNTSLSNLVDAKGFGAEIDLAAASTLR